MEKVITCVECGLNLNEDGLCEFCIKDTGDVVKTGSLFGDGEVLTTWEREWQDMPEFTQEDKSPLQKIVVNFYSRKDVDDFASLIQQAITEKTNSIRYPKANIKAPKNFIYENES